MRADKEIQDIYKKSCQSDLDHYTELCALGIDHDSAGYATPQGLRNVLIISATPLLSPISYPISRVVPKVPPVAFMDDTLSW